MSAVEGFLERHQRLAMALLAIEGGGAAEVAQAMRKIIASAPVGTDVALVLSLALAHAADQVLRTAAPTCL
jgi:hypothetical protein